MITENSSALPRKNRGGKKALGNSGRNDPDLCWFREQRPWTDRGSLHSWMLDIYTEAKKCLRAPVRSFLLSCSLSLSLSVSLPFASSSFSLTIFYSVFRSFGLRPTSLFSLVSGLRLLPSTSVVAFSDRNLLLSYRCILFARTWHLANRLRRSDCTAVRWKRLRCTCSETRPGIEALPSFAIRTMLYLLMILTRYVLIRSASLRRYPFGFCCPANIAGLG